MSENMSLEELQEQVDLTLYDILSNPEKYEKEWAMFGITKEQAEKDIASYHERYGVPDMSKLKKRLTL